MTPRLDVSIVTMAPRLQRLCRPEALPATDGVRYVIACQDPDNQFEDGYIPSPFLGRDDIRFALFRDRGVTRNRNHALDMGDAPLVYVADDDLVFDPQGFRSIMEAFDNNPDLDCALFMAHTPALRTFPPREMDLSKPWPYHYPLNIEIALRRATLQRDRIRFCELVGIGAPRMGAGEEEMMMASLRKRNRRIRFFPRVIVSHPAPTTGERNALKSDVIRAKGAALGTLHPLSGVLPRILLEAWRSKTNFFRALCLISEGYIYYRRHIASKL